MQSVIGHQLNLFRVPYDTLSNVMRESRAGTNILFGITNLCTIVLGKINYLSIIAAVICSCPIEYKVIASILIVAINCLAVLQNSCIRHLPNIYHRNSTFCLPVRGQQRNLVFHYKIVNYKPNSERDRLIGQEVCVSDY